MHWYEAVRGARVVFANPMLTFLISDDQHHRLTAINVPGPPDVRCARRERDGRLDELIQPGSAPAVA